MQVRLIAITSYLGGGGQAFAERTTFKGSSLQETPGSEALIEHVDLALPASEIKEPKPIEGVVVGETGRLEPPSTGLNIVPDEALKKKREGTPEDEMTAARDALLELFKDLQKRVKVGEQEVALYHEQELKDMAMEARAAKDAGDVEKLRVLLAEWTQDRDDRIAGLGLRPPVEEDGEDDRAV